MQGDGRENLGDFDTTWDNWLGDVVDDVVEPTKTTEENPKNFDTIPAPPFIILNTCKFCGECREICNKNNNTTMMQKAILTYCDNKKQFFDLWFTFGLW